MDSIGNVFVPGGRFKLPMTGFVITHWYEDCTSNETASETGMSILNYVISLGTGSSDYDALRQAPDFML